MLLFIFAFFLGDLFLQTFSFLPALTFILPTLILTFLLLILIRNRYYLYLPLAFLLGFTFTSWYASDRLSWSLPKEVEGRPLLVTGYIASLPIIENGITHFIFSAEQFKNDETLMQAKTLLRLSSREKELPAPLYKVGDKYQLLVRLKRIHSSQNLGTFDMEASALTNGLRAVGYVVANPNNKILTHTFFRYPLQQLRQKIYDRLLLYLPHAPHSPWLLALILGERGEVLPEDWQILRKTGTNHLMAIAGLHIGILAGLVHAAVSFFWRRLPFLALRWPALYGSAGAALLAALGYSALAGFSLPTERACIMLIIFYGTLLTKRLSHPWHVWSLAVLFVLLLNPLNVLTDSFWLSFATIGLIIYGMRGRLAPKGWWWKWGRVQWVISIGLVPLSLVLFQQISLVAVFANSLAIPWLAFFILPFCFLSMIFLFIFPSVSAGLLFIADKSLAGLWIVLTALARLHFATWQQAIPNPWFLGFSLLGCLLLLLPAGSPGRWLSVIYLMPLFSYHPARPPLNAVWLTVLDVGQGLSVVVQTKQHTLVYDAGPKYNASADAGENIVLPYLQNQNVKTIDTLVISHGDNDHLGGAEALLQALPVSTIYTSVPEKISRAALCLSGASWQWDGVNFDFLYPTTADLHLGNDSSCVLRIDNGEQSILLTGDIEKYAEHRLLADMPLQLASTILVAPHHGSKTSALKSFIAAIHPQIVLYSTGYRNRYHFPHPSVVATYAERGVDAFNTAETGMITFKLEKNKKISPAELYRVQHKRYWYDV